MGGYKWTQRHLNKLRELYPKAPWPDLLKAFPGRSSPSLVHKANRLNLFRQTSTWETGDHLTLSGYDLGWLVAFTEGEGHLGVYRPARGTFHPAVMWANTEAELTERTQELIQGKGNLRFEDLKSLGRKNIWKLDVRALDDVRQIIELLGPHFIGKKKRIADLILELIRLKSKGAKRRSFDKARQEEIYREVRALNKRGLGDPP